MHKSTYFFGVGRLDCFGQCLSVASMCSICFAMPSVSSFWIPDVSSSNGILPTQLRPSREPPLLRLLTTPLTPTSLSQQDSIVQRL